VTKYYSMLFNPYNREIQISEDANLYIDILSKIYWKDAKIFEEICSCSRYSIYMHFYNGEVLPEDVLAVCSEIAISDKESNVFIEFLSSILNKEIESHNRGDAKEKDRIEKNPLMYNILKALTYYRRGEDILYVCERIIELISNLDSEVYLNVWEDISFYKDFEQWTLDYALIKNKKELEKEDLTHFTSKNSDVINVLQIMLEKLNYKNRRK